MQPLSKAFLHLKEKTKNKNKKSKSYTVVFPYVHCTNKFCFQNSSLCSYFYNVRFPTFVFYPKHSTSLGWCRNQYFCKIHWIFYL